MMGGERAGRAGRETRQGKPSRLSMKGYARVLFLVLLASTFLVGLVLYSVSSEDTGLYFHTKPAISLANVQLPRPHLTAEMSQVSSAAILVHPGSEGPKVYLPAAPTKTTKTKKKASKVLIVAYFRSGSTYFSEMFNFNNQVFYMFEPLAYALLPSNKTLTMLNGQTSTVGKMLKMTYVLQLLDDIFNCRLQALPVWYLQHPFLTKSLRFSRYIRCIQPVGRRPRHTLRFCIQSLIQMCKASPVRAIKVIRLGITVNSMQKLQRTNPDIKFIQLVRDPRGSLLSQFDAAPPETAYIAFKRIVGFCDKMERDLEQIKKLRNSSDIDILTVNYEDMAENPKTAVSAVYSFLGLTLPGRVISGINRRSSASRHDDKFGTVRENSTQTAYAWKKKIKFDIVRTVDTYCSHWYQQLGYLPIATRKELLDETNKHRVPRR